MRRILSALSHRITDAVAGWLSPSVKRLIFLTSLSARLKGSTLFDNETLEKLNRVMVLSSDKNRDMLKLPAHLSKAIWNGKTAFEICGDNLCEGQIDLTRKQRAIQHILAGMPARLRYAPEAKMQQDIEKLLDNRSQLLGI